MNDSFSGFPPAGIQFLAELAENNNKKWFKANKARYEQDLLGPALDFVTAVGQRLQSISPHIQVDTRTNGSGSLMRIYRDVRFSEDKSPYKTNLSGMWWEGEGKKTLSPAFGFQLNPEGMAVMAGMFQFDKAQLQAYREAVADEEMGTALQEAVTAVADDTYELVGQHYKRVPRGFDAEHPRADLLRHNALYVHPRRPIPIEVVTSPQLVDVCMDHFQHMAPVQRWLVAVLNNPL